MVMAPIPVSSGFGWTAAGAWATAITLGGGILTLIIRQIGPWRKQTTEAEQRLREELTTRVTKLEHRLERQQTRFEAERSLYRHTIANLNQCFDAVMLMLETAPERTAEVVAKVRTMREAQIAAESLEKSTIHAAEIAADAEDERSIA